MLAKTKIFARLVGLMSLMLVLMALVAGFGLYGISETKSNVDGLYKNNFLPVKQVDSAIEYLYRARLSALGAAGKPISSRTSAVRSGSSSRTSS